MFQASVGIEEQRLALIRLSSNTVKRLSIPLHLDILKAELTADTLSEIP